MSIRSSATPFALALALVVLPIPIRAQIAPPAAGTIVRERVHSPALEGNLLGDPADQDVAIYLPPGYEADAPRRYPVLYLLHGIGDSPDVWLGAAYQGLEIDAVMDSLIASGSIQPMIVVMPNATNRYVGTYYTNSPVSGGWEDYVWRDLVAHVDSSYRTLVRPESRAVAGHSMGGFGAIRMGMRHPDVFSAVWAMNPCCLAMVEDLSLEDPGIFGIQVLETQADVDAALERGDWYPVAVLALASAFSPRPDRPPLYVELPYRIDDGEVAPVEPAYSEWRAAVPVAQVREQADELRRLAALGFDTAFEDEFSHIPTSSRMLADSLAVMDVPHVFEMYEGDHRNRIRERMTTIVLPFLSRHLEGDDDGD